MPTIAPHGSYQVRLHCTMLLAALLSGLLVPVQAQNLSFTLPGLDNQPVRLSDFQGRWVILNFWASWCTPCLLEMPELQAFYEKNRHRATVVGVNFENRLASEVRTFVEQLAITFPIVLTKGQPISGFDLKGLPMTFLISPTGKLMDTHLGAVNAVMLEERLAELEKIGG